MIRGFSIANPPSGNISEKKKEEKKGQEKDKKTDSRKRREAE
jgi:hypothetical protein